MKEPDEAPKKGRKKKGKAAGGEKEHKTPWQEKYASPEEIEDFLKDHIYLRRNVVTMRTEWREPSSYESDGTTDWQPISDWKLNTLWKKMMKEKPVIFDHMKKVINSDSFDDYHPFRYYLEHLPPWDHRNDYIMEMSLSVSVKGEVEEQMLFYEYLKKWLVVTMPSIDERAAYAHYHEHRQHIASFCGTGNNVQFLSDPTGNRRWLPFEVERIDSPRDNPFNYEGIYSQAYALYQEGFQFWFSQEEIRALTSHNRQFETPRLEMELASLYFRQPTEVESGEFISVARAMQIVSANISQKLSSVHLGRALCDLGFRRVKYQGVRGYIVVCRKADEMQMVQRSMAREASPDGWTEDSNGQ